MSSQSTRPLRLAKHLLPKEITDIVECPSRAAYSRPRLEGKTWTMPSHVSTCDGPTLALDTLTIAQRIVEEDLIFTNVYSHWRQSGQIGI